MEEKREIMEKNMKLFFVSLHKNRMENREKMEKNAKKKERKRRKK